VDEIRGLSDGLMVGVRWMEKVGERWGMGGFYVSEVRKEACSQSDDTWRSDQLNRDTYPHKRRSCNSQHNSFYGVLLLRQLDWNTIALNQGLANSQFPSHEVARASSRGLSGEVALLARAALTSIVKLKPQSPKQLPNSQVYASCPPQRIIEGTSVNLARRVQHS